MKMGESWSSDSLFGSDIFCKSHGFQPVDMLVFIAAIALYARKTGIEDI
jgi:hypothetical protein